ncbi:hypothetical protein FRC00_008989, partial [Tulasnella sp. 408]
DGEGRVELSFFQAVVNLRAAELLLHARRFYEKKDSLGAILGFDAWVHSKILESMEAESVGQVADMLRACRQYCTVVKVVVQHREFFDKPFTQRLFGIYSSSDPSSHNEQDQQDVTAYRLVRPRSLIYSKASRIVGLQLKATDTPTPITVLKDTADDLMSRELLLRLNASLWTIHQHALKSAAFELCNRYLATGRCASYEEGKCWRGHVQPSELTIQSFNSRLRIHLLMIALLDQFAAVEGVVDTERDAERDRAAMQRNLLVTSMLATAIDYTEANKYLWRGQWFLDKDIAAKDELLQKDGQPVAGAALTWFARNTPTRHYLGVYTIEIRHIVYRRVAIDVDVAVAFIEEVCGQLILNHFRSSYEGLTMPRTWLIRALLRGTSHKPNGSMSFVLVPALSAFLKALSGNADPGYFQVHGAWLSESATPVSTITRLCRAMALLGLNVDNEKLQGQILKAYQPLNKPRMQRMDFNKFATASKWDEVQDALQTSMTGSSMDELITITYKRQARASVAGIRQIFCQDDKDLLRKLMISPHVPLAAPSIMPKQPENPNPPKVEVQAGAIKDGEAPTERAVQMEGVDYKPIHHKGASTIQAFFRRHRRRAGGPIASAFEDLVKRRALLANADPPSRFLLLSLRGSLPHVVASLQKLKDISQGAVTALNKKMQVSQHQELDDLHSQALEIRRIRNSINRLIKELQPTSEFYLQNGAGSLQQITEKVKMIPDLVNGIRKFTSCPKDLDYELGVEALLSNRVPWAPKKPTARKPLRPTLNASDIDGDEEY